MVRPLRLLTTSIIACLALTAACARGGGAGPSGPASTPPSASALTSAAPTARPTATASATQAEPVESLSPFACGLPTQHAATTDRAQITAVRVGTHAGYDRIVIEFEHGLPESILERASLPLAHDPSGLPMTVAGDSFLHLVLHGASAVRPDGSPSDTGALSFTPRFGQLVDLQSAGDYEAVASWYIGLRTQACIRVFTLSQPDRLVIDVEH